MEEGDTTDEESMTETAPRASSSSHMTSEEEAVLRRIREKLKDNENLRIVHVHKSREQTVIACKVLLAVGAGETELVIYHEISPEKAIFHISTNEDWLAIPLNAFCRGDIVTLRSLFGRISELVEQRRLALFMESLQIEPQNETTNEESGSEEEAPTISSGTTAASPQSSRSTTTSMSREGGDRLA
jgi:hypothetical protein